MGIVADFAKAFNARDVNGLLACFTERASELLLHSLSEARPSGVRSRRPHGAAISIRRGLGDRRLQCLSDQKRDGGGKS